jgi:hypothetical protein
MKKLNKFLKALVVILIVGIGFTINFYKNNTDFCQKAYVYSLNTIGRDSTQNYSRELYSASFRLIEKGFYFFTPF